MISFVRHDSTLIMISVLLGLGCAVLPQHALVQLPIASPLLFYLPGYSLLRAVGLQHHSPAERLLLAVGMSIAIVIICGLLLHSIGGISRSGWIICLSVVTSALALVAMFRRPTSRNVLNVKNAFIGFKAVHATVFTAGIGICLAAIFIAVQDEARKRQFSATEFWLLPKNPHEDHLLSLGIRSREPGSMTVSIELKVNGRLDSVWKDIVVDAGQTVMKEIEIPVVMAQPQKVEAWLLSGGNSASIYRKVSYIIKPAERR